MLIQDWILCIIFMATILFLLFSCKWNAAKYNNKWRIFYLVPFVICIIHALVAGTEWCLSGIYIGALIMIGGYLVAKVSWRKKCSIIAIVLCLITIPVCIFSGSYRTADYLKDFEEGFATMKEYYSLAEHKKIDWDALYEEYYPLFEEADKSQDKVKNLAAWGQFCNEFYDCHTGYVPTKDYKETKESLTQSIIGNDYGLSMVQLTSGEYVAVSVEENSEAAKAGIHTGTVITKWDGTSIEDLLPTALERMQKSLLIGNIENQNFYVSLFVPGIGGDQIQVTFINDNGEEATVTLDALGNYYERFLSTYNTLTYKTPRENMGVVRLNEETILLNVNMMGYDSDAMETADYSSMQSEIREAFITYREEGATKLIIDLRNNSGGSSMMAKAIVSLLADGEFFWAADGSYNKETKEYEVMRNYTGYGENLWESGEIIVLVNSGSNSAANHLIAGVQGLDYVTVMGLSEPAGTAQGCTQIPLKNGSLSFSITTVLDENGEIWIDSDETGHCRLLVDDRIPLTKEALVKMFDEKTDYALDYALEYFEYK